jgi:hypothetical protein
MTNDPMKDIEDRKGQFDMGVMAIRTFQGAMSEAENWWEAFMATCAFFTGMFKSSQDPPEEEK